MKIPRRWSNLFKLLPGGYDPVSTAHGAWFDAQRADEAIAFIEEVCVHVEGDMAGQPFVLEEWQKAVVGCLFGWYVNDSYGRCVRRYVEVLLYIARKNGKTPLCAAICLLILLTDGEVGAQIYGAAASREQAALLYRHARGMLEHDEELRDLVKFYGTEMGAGTRTIEYVKNRSFYKVVSSDGKLQHGQNVSAALIDELHAIDGVDLVEALTTGTASKNRKQTLTIFITTADHLRESVCNQKYDYACKVRDGVVDDSRFFPVVFEFPTNVLKQDPGAWVDPQYWALANPNIDVSVSRDYLMREAKKAAEDPAVENSFKRLHLNIRTQQDTRYLSVPHWVDCGDPSLDIEDFYGRPCYPSLDLASTQDLVSLCLTFKDDESEAITQFWHHWSPRDRALETREKGEAADYMAWSAAGHLLLHDGAEIEYDKLQAEIIAILDRFDLIAIGVDRAWQGAQITQSLMRRFGEDKVFAFTNSYEKMSAPTKMYRSLIERKLITHDGNPIMKWQIGNLEVKIGENDDVKPVRPKGESRKNKIDGVMTGIMGLALSMAVSGKRSAYGENAGLKML